MKKLLFICLFIIPLASFSQGLNAIYSFTTFNNPKDKPYVEISISIDASSINYVASKNGENQGLLDLLTVIKKNNEIIYADKKELIAPEQSNLEEFKKSILNTSRIALEDGKYYLEIVIKDKNSISQPLEILDSIIIDYPKNQVSISDVQMIDNYSKSKESSAISKYGYDIIPYLFDAIPDNKNKITFLSEIYNADKQFGNNRPFVFSYYLHDVVLDKKIEKYSRIKRELAKDINLEMIQIDISDLPRGTYFLYTEVRDSNNMLYAYKKEAFVRYSSKMPDYLLETGTLPNNAFVNRMTEDDVNQKIEIVFSVENKNIHIAKDELKTKDEKKYFLYNFFRMRNIDNPELAYNEYMTLIEYINKEYSTAIKLGIKTDMGRVILDYGIPDKVIDEKYKISSGLKEVNSVFKQQQIAVNDGDRTMEGIAYMPYQIWMYKKTPQGEGNKKFVFYAPHNNLMEYFLLHSDAKGEKFDINWEYTLSRETLDIGTIGEAGMQFLRGY